MKNKNIDLHNKCQCEIRWRQFKGKTEFTPGLFCSNHNVFLDWLSLVDANLLIDNGIKEAPYLDRKKPKKQPAKTGFYKIPKKKRRITRNDFFGV